jgi:hypothetical protein
MLMMVMRNATTDSPWPVSNNPRAKYNQLDRQDCNLRLPLWQLLRASTAAPTFFPPEVVTFAPWYGQGVSIRLRRRRRHHLQQPGVPGFPDGHRGAVSGRLEDRQRNLLIVSVGTGGAANARPDLKADDLWLLDNARNLPGALMNAASAGWDMACRTLGECRFGPNIDREFGDMVMAPGASANASTGKQFAYLRYDPDVSQAGIDALGLGGIEARKVQVMDSVKNIGDIQKVGQTYAARNVSIDHLRGFA